MYNTDVTLQGLPANVEGNLKGLRAATNLTCTCLTVLVLLSGISHRSKLPDTEVREE